MWLRPPVFAVAPCVLVGDEATILAAADLVGVSRRRFMRFEGKAERSREDLRSLGRTRARQDGSAAGPPQPSRRRRAAELDRRCL